MAKNKTIPKCPPLRFPQFNDEWKQTMLGEIGTYIRGLTYNSDDVQGSGYIVVRANNITEGKAINFDNELVQVRVPPSTQQMLMVNDIAICMANGSSHLVGKASYYNGNASGVCTVGAFCGIFRSTNPLTRWFFQTSIYNRYIYQSIQGGDGAIANLKGEDILKQIYSLPSLAEQKKIASFLSLIDERIQSCSETIKERKREKAALLNQLFSQKLRFPQFSDEWQQTTLGEICTIKTGKLDANAMIEGGRYPFFTCAKQTYQTDTYSFSGEAILVAGNGEVGLTKYYNGKFNAYQRTYVLQSLRRDIILRLIRNYIDHALPKRIVSLRNGSAMPYITLSTLRDMPIFLPSLAEQKKIADFLSLIDERIEVEEELLEQYEKQKRYLLRQMFV